MQQKQTQLPTCRQHSIGACIFPRAIEPTSTGVPKSAPPGLDKGIYNMDKITTPPQYVTSIDLVR